MRLVRVKVISRTTFFKSQIDIFMLKKEIVLCESRIDLIRIHIGAVGSEFVISLWLNSNWLKMQENI